MIGFDAVFQRRMTEEQVEQTATYFATLAGLHIRQDDERARWTLHSTPGVDADPVITVTLDRKENAFVVEHHRAPVPTFEGELICTMYRKAVVSKSNRGRDAIATARYRLDIDGIDQRFGPYTYHDVRAQLEMITELSGPEIRNVILDAFTQDSVEIQVR